MSEYNLLIAITITWGLAVVLYYFAGKKHGYAKGYIDGIQQGHKNVLDAFNAKSDYINEVKP